MLSRYLMLISFIALIGGSLCYLINAILYFRHKEEKLIFQIFGILFMGIVIISALSGVVEKEIALKTSSSSYYYDMLEQKTFIEEQIKAHKKEIEVLRNGEVNGVAFKSKNEMVNLSNTIKRYNRIILIQQEYKDNYWHNERYNEAVANLNTFEEIF